MSRTSYVPTANAPIVNIAAWEKTDRRQGVNPRTQQEFNDPHMNVKLQLNTVKLAEIVADALGKGQVSVEILGGCWLNEPKGTNDPHMTGNCNVTRADIEARQVNAAKDSAARALAAAQGMKLDTTTGELTPNDDEMPAVASA